LDSLFNVFVFLVIACIIVAIAGRFRLGSVLGCLAAGALVGPYGLGFVDDPAEIMHFAEFGVIMMLFLIGLDLEPKTLWRLRKSLVGLGGFQMAGTTAAFAGIGLLLGFPWQDSVVVGMALALSSTALVLQMLEEKGLMKTAAGESSFSVLLFQDIAVIPILVALPLMAGHKAHLAMHQSALSHMPGWAQTLIIAGVIIAIVVAGRFLSRPVFYFLAKSNLREVFTAMSLALVVGITLLMEKLGVSPALGAFIAGMVLANSEYRHTLETDIQPFKGLLIALFFISIGMGINITLLTGNPWWVLGAFIGLMLIKGGILWGLGHAFGLRGAQKAMFAGALAQGGEFSFVLFQYAGGLSILDKEQIAFLNLAVTLSMMATPLAMIIVDKFVIPHFMVPLPKREYDKITETGSVIIAGYGRFGQIIGRFLTAQGVKVVVLEENPDQIEQLHKFGAQAYFGDASRLDLLRSAGAEKAKLLVVAIDNADKGLEIVKLAKANFPNLKVYARARNRRHAYELFKAGVDYYRREVFDSSLRMGKDIMKVLGVSESDVEHRAHLFMEHDEKTLHRSFAFFEKESELISFSRQATGELQQILQEDMASTGRPGEIAGQANFVVESKN
jgi:glutathione-regulated potassium-efflux system ancillary protein KefC